MPAVRVLYGRDISSFTMYGNRFAGGVLCAIWLDAMATTQTLDLAEVAVVNDALVAGDPMTEVTSDDDGLIQFFGPANYDGPLWVTSANATKPLLIRPIYATPSPTPESILGSALADDAVDARILAPDAVDTSAIVDLNVTTGKLAAGAVTTAKIADDAVTTGKIAAGAVGTTDLADGAVTDAKVSDVALAKVTGAGTAAGLNVPASGDATSGQVVKGSDSRLTDTRTPKAHKASHATGQADALAPSDIGAVPVTRTLNPGTGLTGGGDLSADRTLGVAAGGIGTTQLADGAVTTAKIGNGQVQNANLGDGAVTSRVLATGAVNSAAIEDATIVNGDIATNAAIAASKISGTALVASTADAKGDLYVATANDTVARLAVGANNTILTADSTAGSGVKWATPTTLVGSGSPLGVVTPDFKGQEFVDTAQTLGARKWVATGTTSASWVVSDGDTGWRDVTALVAAGVRTSNPGLLLRVRRVRERVTWQLRETSAGSATGTVTLIDSPLSGFMPNSPDGGSATKRFRPVFVDDTAALIAGTTFYVDVSSAIVFGATVARKHAESEFGVTSAWPTTLPGTAV